MVAGTTSCQCALYRAAMSLLGIGEVFLQLSESGLSPTSMLVRLEVFLLRVELLEQVHGLLVHGEHNPSTQLKEASVSIPLKSTHLLTMRRARRGVVPVQNRRMPSSVKMRYAQ